jgi:transcription elongation factor
MGAGKPFAAVIPIRNADEETVALSTNRKFMTIIDRSRARIKKAGGISATELRRRLGLEKQLPHFDVSGIPETWKSSPPRLNPSNDLNGAKRLKGWNN